MWRATSSYPEWNRVAKRLDALQDQVIELHKARETAVENPELLSEVQGLKYKLDEHSKQLDESAEKLGALEAKNLVLRNENQALNTTSNKRRRLRTQVWSMHSLNTSIDADDEAQRPVPTDEEPAAGTSTARSTQVHDDKDSDSEMENEDGAPEGVTTSQTTITAYLEKMFSKKFDAIQSMGERLPGVASPSPIQRSDPNSYANTPFVDEIALVEMPPKFPFPNVRMYDGTSDPDNHVAQYKKRMLTIAI